jgi:predicted nuclease of predicted toxin-antitoxin system
MRILLDTCIADGARAHLEAAGHDVVCTHDWPADPGDEQILAWANAERRVLVTIDKDFGDLAVLRGLPHCGIVRLVGLRAIEHGRLAEVVLSLYRSDLEAGALVTAEPGRVRVRPPA